MSEQPSKKIDVAAGGIDGFDELVGGGLPRRRMYLIEGQPGVGKTTFALQFAMRGVADGERVLYVLMSETEREIQEIAASHGWSLDGVEMLFFSQSDFLQQDTQQTMLHPAEVELPEATRPIIDRIRDFRPERLVLDSLSEFRLLARHERYFRRQIVALKEYLANQGCTTLILDSRVGTLQDQPVQTVASGVIQLELITPEFGPYRRRLQIRKVRGLQHAGGYHDYVIRPGGITVYPRLVAAQHRCSYEPAEFVSGNDALDALAGGGLDRGTSTAIIGPAGVGKSTIALQYVDAAAERGQSAAIYAFDERLETIYRRAAGVGMDLRRHVDAGLIRLQQLDPAEMTPGEFSQLVRRDIEEGKQLIVLDSLSGYFQSMPEENLLMLHLHDLLAYLNEQGAVTILVMAQHGFLGPQMQPPVDISYIADNVLLLRYFEYDGGIRKAISTLKRRSGTHEHLLRELQLTSAGVAIGEPLTHFRGIFSGTPSFDGPPAGENRPDA